jgi:hypothetical protein
MFLISYFLFFDIRYTYNTHIALGSCVSKLFFLSLIHLQTTLSVYTNARTHTKVNSSELETPAKLVDFNNTNSTTKRSRKTSTSSSNNSSSSSSGGGGGGGSPSLQAEGEVDDDDDDDVTNEFKKKKVDTKHVGDESKMKLYGLWQTSPWQPPNCFDEFGKLPRNIHGNYELWGGEEKLLPKHTVWLRMPKVREKLWF